MFTKHDYNKVKVGANLIWTNHAKVWELFMICIRYNNVVKEILPFNQEVLCMNWRILDSIFVKNYIAFLWRY